MQRVQKAQYNELIIHDCMNSNCDSLITIQPKYEHFSILYSLIKARLGINVLALFLLLSFSSKIFSHREVLI